MYNIDKDLIIMIVGVVIVVAAIIIALVKMLASPFDYPYFHKEFDVSGKRNVKFKDELDKYINNGGFDRIEAHNKIITDYKKSSEEYLEHCKLKKYRKRQYLYSLDDDNAYSFDIVRQQTRYKQKNYVRTPYKVTQVQESYDFGYGALLNRYKKLEEINFETTLSKYNSNNQRKLLTPKLKNKIKERDNYTCQLCGKYMPDEIGLHIDHIVPISKGGKTVESNLQVLCSRCNAEKSNKVPKVD